MAWGAIEIGTIARSQDFTTIKQNEDNKGLAQQMTIGNERQQENEQKTRQVNQNDNADWHQRNFDASEQGNGTYAGNGGRDRKKKEPEPDGKVVLKGRSGFDIKI